jgi:hypothetical protein
LVGACPRLEVERIVKLRLRVATLAFLTILTLDLVDGPPPSVPCAGCADAGSNMVEADGLTPHDAEFFCERSTVAAPFLLSVSANAPEPIAPPEPVHTAGGFVTAPFHPPRSSR